MQSKQVEQAVNCFKSGFSCSQAVLSAYAGQFGLDETTALKVSGAFGGGIAGMAGTCGAVTGAFMVIGLKYGKTSPKDDEAKKKTYALVKEFIKRFKAKHSSIICRELLGCDIGTEDGAKAFKEKNLINTVCPNLVQTSAEILEQII